MHMQDGVGRSGYRLLATVFLGLGVLGLVTTLYAFVQASSPAGLFDWLGFGLSFVALIALYSLALVILLKGPAATQPEPAANAPAPVPTRPIEFEFREPERGPEVAIPLADAAPPKPANPMVVQPNRNLSRDTKGWPRRQPPSGLTLGEKRQLQEEAVQLLTSAGGSTGDIEFEAAPPRPRNGAAGGVPSPVARRAAPAREAARANDMTIRAEPPAMIARVAGPDDDPAWNPEGTTVGKCGGCGTRLYAPKERPIRLRCPKCEKVTTLQ